MTTRRPPVVVLAMLLALLLAMAASAMPLAGGTHNPCADGGSERPDEGGIGGTGARPGSDEGGIGGTGFTGRGPVGVIGTITAFGSICVGPTEVHYTADTPVQIDGRAVAANALAVGQVVELVADGTNGELHAREVVLRHVVQGPITRVGDTDRIEIMGQTVVVPPAARTTWVVGDVVQVSGMRRADGVIDGSRIIRIEATDAVTLSGLWRDGTIGVTRVESAVPQSIPNDAEVRVSGRWDGAAIRGASVEDLPTLPFAGRIERVALEGFARPAPDGTLRVDRFPVTGTAVADLVARAGADARVRIEALVRDRTLVVERVERIELPRLRSSGSAGGPPRGLELHGDGSGPPPDDARPGGPGRDLAPPPHPENGAMHLEGGDRPDRPDRSGHPERPDRPERPAPPDRPDVPRPERPNHAGPPDGPPPRPDGPPR